MRNAATQRRYGQARMWRGARAFSLIEILIAVIILALGLLGLGAVFPVVIREQKLARDRISGTVAENNVRALISGMEQLSRRRAVVPFDPLSPSAAVLTDVYTGWAVLQEPWRYYEGLNNQLSRPDTTYIPPDFVNRFPFTFSRDGTFEIDWSVNPQAPRANEGYHVGAPGTPPILPGNIALVTEEGFAGRTAVQEQFPQAERNARREALAQSGNPSQLTFRHTFLKFQIPLEARLNPGGDTGDESPTTVWDVVARRKLETPDPRALQVAVFIRRVDPQLRPLPRQNATADNDTIPVREQFFSRTLPTGQERLPLGEDRFGLPTQDGTGGAGDVYYSGVHSVNAAFYFRLSDQISRKRDHISIAGIGADEALISQTGQRVVDNLGNVYTVVKADAYGLKIDPPVPPSVLETTGTVDPTLPTIRQLVFTPQIPASVFIMEIEP